jgi:hypothetical protein
MLPTKQRKYIKDFAKKERSHTREDTQSLITTSRGKQQLLVVYNLITFRLESLIVTGSIRGTTASDELLGATTVTHILRLAAERSKQHKAYPKITSGSLQLVGHLKVELRNSAPFKNSTT